MTVLTTEDLKSVLQISMKKAKALMRTDGFPSFRIGREYRVTEDALLRWMTEIDTVKVDYSRV